MILKRNQQCVINTDLDGFLCGMLLQHFLDWEVVGFCNSRDSFWFAEGIKIKNVVFVDIFMASSQLKCLDQHIVSVDQEHNEMLKQNPNKLNPNILRDRTFLGSNYHRKFPFGTVHFLISELEKMGFDVKGALPLKKTVFGMVRVIDIFLRADDALYSTAVKYRENTQDWWAWLGSGACTVAFKGYCSLLEANTDQRRILLIKRNIQNYFSVKINTNTADGGYKDPNAFGYEEISMGVVRYFEQLAQWLEIRPIQIPSRLNYINERREVDDFYSHDSDLLKRRGSFKNKRILSYAFISSANSDGNFSYTYRRKKDGTQSLPTKPSK